MTLWILCTITALAWCVSTFEEDAFWPDRAKRLSFASDSEKNVRLTDLVFIEHIDLFIYIM